MAAHFLSWEPQGPQLFHLSPESNILRLVKMQVNQQLEGSNNDESEQSDDVQIVLALRKIMAKEIEVMVIRAVQQVIGPIMGDLVRKVVKEEIRSAQDKLLISGIRNHEDDIITSRERSLHLKFLDNEVSGPVLTGKEIKGKGGSPMTVALIDKTTEQVVDCGPGSSATVEILILDSSGDDDARNWGGEDFNNRIIRDGDKKKPHFAKCNYIYLKEGIGFLNNSKLGHDSNWMKSCKCRLGARIVESFGIKVQAAWTKSFMVMDSRSKLYEKSYRPSLSDDIWRLNNIAKDGAPCKRLNLMNILTVKDFLFLHSVDPERLQRIAAGAKGRATIAKWKATVDHAQTCIIDDNKIYLYRPSSESTTGVTFDAVGGLKGLIHDSLYVPINNLSEAEKDCAHKLLRSAYENQKDITSFVDETSLLDQYPYRSSDMNGCGLATSETINDDPSEPGTSRQSSTPTVIHSGSIGQITLEQSYDPHFEVPNSGPRCSLSDLEPVTSSHSINSIRQLSSLGSFTMGQVNNPHLAVSYPSPSYSFSDLGPGTSSHCINTICHFGSLESITTGQVNDAHLGVPHWGPHCSFPILEPGTSSQSMDTIPHFGSLGSITMGQSHEPHLPAYQSPSCSFFDFEHFGDFENLMSFPEANCIPQTLEADSHSHQQSNASGINLVEVVDALLWIVRARKKIMASRNFRLQKKHRIR
ncbi:hypothetical protein BUALT_Bualt07G0041700 [Buddleja alternifolia]|uniref:Calmodulin-binding protein n=1 Tax=Buddleja alternifolia TaxID=168488 RepID=A0AAV6X7U7_9LAMI|nr:hypothetical protein BUALT_Bualt07G0041700 [Buddleja alternifolia]